MKGLIWFVVVAACAVALALLARISAGYVLLVAPPWRIEVSLVLAVVLAALGFALLYALLRLISNALSLPGYVAAFRLERRNRQARNALVRAWRAYFEGRFGHALQQAAKAFQAGESPALAALLAARSAHFMRDTERRELWLARAQGATDDDRNARLATQAELLLDEREFAQAHDVLRQLHAAGPRHVSTLRMMLRAEQGLGHWDEVLRLTRQLQKRDAISPERAHQYRLTASVQRIRELALEPDPLKTFFDSLDAAERVEPAVALEAARACIAAGEAGSATSIALASIEAHWDEAVVAIWAQCADTAAVNRLERAERWLRDRPADGVLLRVLGQLCLERELWGKAQSYFEASLATQAHRTTHLDLARLLDRLGRTDSANAQYRAAGEFQ